MQRAMLLAVTLAMLTSLAVAAGTTYSLEQVPANGISRCYAQLSWSNSSPAGYGEMPKCHADKIWYAQLKLGDNDPMLLIFDSGDLKSRNGLSTSSLVVPQKAVETVPVLHADVNCDREIADSEAFEMAWDGRGSYSTGVISVPVTYILTGGEAAEHTYSFKMVISGYSGLRPSPLLTMCHESVWSGEVDLGGKSVRVTLLDGDGNARIASANSGSRDMVWLDDNGDGKRAAEEYGPLMKYIETGAGFAELSPRIDGAKVTLTPYEGPLGTVKLQAKDGRGEPMNVSQVVFYRDNVRVSRTGVTSELSLIPGQYKFYYGLSRLGDPDKLYSFVAPDPVTVSADRPTELLCGPELSLDVSAKLTSLIRGTAVVTVTLDPRGKGSGHQFRGTSATSAAGKVEFVDASGKVVASGKATYG